MHFVVSFLNVEINIITLNFFQTKKASSLAFSIEEKENKIWS